MAVDQIELFGISGERAALTLSPEPYSITQFG